MVSVWELLASRRERIFSRALRSRVDAAAVYDAVSDKLLSIEARGGWPSDPRAQTVYYSKTVASCIVSQSRVQARRGLIVRAFPTVPEVLVEEDPQAQARDVLSQLFHAVGEEERELLDVMLRHFESADSSRSLLRTIALHFKVSESTASTMVRRLRERAKRQDCSFV